MRSQARGLLAASLSVAAAFLVVELSLRAAGYAPLANALHGKGAMVLRSDRPDLGYELVPGTRGPGWGTEVEINSAGFRDREYPPEKHGRSRIVALGDSITFGNNLEPEETWPEQLERSFEDQGRQVDVLDLGVPGYDTCQEVALLEHVGLRFHPDLVVLGFCVNDLGIVSVTKAHAFSSADGERLLYRSRIAQWIRALRAERERKRRLFLDNDEERYARVYAAEILPLDGHPELVERMTALRIAMETAREASAPVRRIPRWFTSPARIGRLEYAFTRLARLAREQRFEVLVLLIPFLDEDPFLEEGLAIVGQLALASGFEVVDAGPAFRSRGLRSLRISPADPIHPGAEGHALLARAVEERVRERFPARAAD